MKVVGIIQARMGSTRLPNKVFADICGKPFIWHVVNRLKYSKTIDEIILATTINPMDDVLEEWAKENGIAFFRGSEEDVLSRFYQAAQAGNADAIVRITADDPFKDPEIIDSVVEKLKKQKLDFAYNNNPPTFPEGLDTEVFTFDALEKAQKNSTDPFEREHVTQYFYRNADKFKQTNISYKQNLSYLRWTIDEEKDLKMAKEVYNALYKSDKIFLMKDILDLLKTNPDIALINTNVKRSAMYLNVDEEQ